MKATIKCILCCYKANIFTSNLLNHILSEMGWFTPHTSCISCLLDYVKSKSRLPIPEFSGFHCTLWMFMAEMRIIYA